MKAGALAALLLAGPVEAQGLIGQALCQAVWDRVEDGLSGIFPLKGTVLSSADGTCEIGDILLDLPGEYTPDWRADRIWLSGQALPWLVGDAATPDRLDLRVEGLHFLISTDMAQLDYLYAAQARAQPIRGEIALAWDKEAKRLTIERLEIDFPGDNLVQLSAEIDQIDLSTQAAMQMSLTGLALKRADLAVRTHGLFEWYVLMPLGPMLLPSEGDMAAAMAELKAEAVTLIQALPAASFPEASKTSLATLTGEMPNPAGTLTVTVDASDGFGPTRFMGYAATGAPGSFEGLAALLDGVTFAIGWTHEETR
jgi:hypothetical protein